MTYYLVKGKQTRFFKQVETGYQVDYITWVKEERGWALSEERIVSNERAAELVKHLIDLGYQIHNKDKEDI